MVDSALSRPGQRERYDSKITQINWVFVICLIALASIGMLLQYSAGGMSWQPWAYKQLIVFCTCLVLTLCLALVDLRVWLWICYPFYTISLLLLVAVEVIGDVRMGAQRWLEIGSFSFQPSEFMKLAIVLGLARFYHEASAKDANLSWKLIIPALMIAVPTGLVMHQPDLGTALLIAFTGGAVMILAGLNWKIIAAAAAGAVVMVPIAFQYILHDYQRNRILTFLNPEADPSGTGYHILQSKIAMGSGGLLGKGLGLGSQSQLNFLPEKHTDFIMAGVCEELGFAGGFAVFALAGALIFMALRMASVSHSHFGRLAAAGTTATFALYVLINGAMVMGLAPVVGIPMALVSYGGSVMLTVMAGFGLILGVRVHRYQELPRQQSIFARFE
ncbi:MULTISPECIES: rod shape-determining protein RodA [Asticcacaulis]|uniref:rod shape-determining protein RodA n=1 Tax=Asticcacaulis TaxID=76890 RepID=UPI001AEAD221|nr:MULTISPECIES: rod shape-determining protein RodA [Asticcacaulis]MBP2160898.1 rod shape determining protein RodA [Asticcacaulis solisilvae]MDR6801898.1 rod shape determining protein RodA [Asticcacaulis sp. BE141]